MACGLTATEWFNLIIPYLEEVDDVVRLRMVSHAFRDSQRLTDYELQRIKCCFHPYSPQYWNKTSIDRTISIYNISYQYGQLISMQYDTHYLSIEPPRIGVFSTQRRFVQHFCNYIASYKHDILSRMRKSSVAIEICLGPCASIYISRSKSRHCRYSGLTTQMIIDNLPYIHGSVDTVDTIKYILNKAGVSFIL